ncbi:IPT/TIG domain-containing protein [Paludibaculum fermentans]|uniref:IPT/TIG domain-containing protein n=1 Tax=Paludibaculum fermentans TaxID=1473598 RepID=UPI003EB89CEC
MRNSIKFLFILAILPASNLFAQFASLSTTNDGSVLYFTTPLVRTGTDQPAHGKTFRIGANGLEVVEIRTVTPTAEGSRITNYYDIERVTVSGDGSVVATAARRDCNAMGCSRIPNQMTNAVGSGPAVEFTGAATMSTNGRYLVNYVTPAPDRADPLVQLDMTTGESWTLLGTVPTSPHVLTTARLVADNGLVTGLINNRDLAVWERGEPRQLTFGSEAIENATIDALGKSVLFVSRWPVPYDTYPRLRRVDLVTGALVTVHEGFPSYSQPRLSNDGSVITFQSERQLFVIHSDGSGLRKLTDETDGIDYSNLSGDGRVAFATTNGGRLVRVDVETAQVTEILGRTLSPRSWLNYPSPGSALLISGSAMDQPGLTVTIGGLNAPIIEAIPGQLTVQVPWEVPVDVSTTVSIVSTAKSEFTAGLDKTGAPRQWIPYRLGAPLHENRDRPVTHDDPAQPNEIIHFFLAGLGPVSVPVRTGVPQPAEPSPVLARSLACYHGGSIPGPATELLYAGLEPGALGVYRVSVRMPIEGDKGTPWLINLACQAAGSSTIDLSLEVPFVN